MQHLFQYPLPAAITENKSGIWSFYPEVMEMKKKKKKCCKAFKEDKRCKKCPANC